MNPWHEGEVAVQQRFGVDERLAEIGTRIIRDHMPGQHRELFRKLPLLVVGSVDAQRRPTASLLTGPPGFITDPDDRHLAITARPAAGDPLAKRLRPGAALGLLGIETETRRRNRMNGAVVATTDHGFTVEVEQSFGNCPQYITARTLPRPALGEATPGGTKLDPAALAQITAADTFFIASATPAPRPGEGGVDVSHRGGEPGFVHIAGGTVLHWHEERGNYFFNTLGNLHLNPWAGLLFVDPATGARLQVEGPVEVDGPEVALVVATHRRWGGTTVSA